MRSFHDAKLMAKTLGRELAARNRPLSHGECLDIVARQFGLGDWNVLAARLQDKSKSEDAPPLGLPKGWFLSGSKPKFYEAGIDTTTEVGGSRPALIRCRYYANDPFYASLEIGFATLMQSIDATPFRGRQIRLKADLRTQTVVDSATLWFRVDGHPGHILAFDNMEDRPDDGSLTGTRDWTERRIVLDVPDAAESLHYGFLLRGSGCVWAAGFDLATTQGERSTAMKRGFLAAPTNLNFLENDAA